ncbi:CaiB/BaiF CoA transferase family protein [Nocardioides ochotonae]|uniref:CaiB/BaiF CoA transferase family protein n=1 Tax=Nocardioides ochotonae TaxID=2685869 RepID=UPI00140D65F9|nr:CaiB/BaiF CoA-transferase family protein [Nocardioides ochotonae]
MSGPLAGVRVVELVAQGPAPFACMLLADLGAEVIGIERPGTQRHAPDAHSRGRRSVALDLKQDAGREVLLDLLADADVLVEGFRPGVTERLGVGPQECHARNPALVYARMTGWGQDGPLAQRAGHDINYLALTGALAAIGEPGRAPVPPLNLAADYGGGGMLLALGILAALHERTASGLGQVVDTAMVDGVGLMLAPFHAMAARGQWRERGTNLLDGGAPFYRVYRTSDDRWLSVGAIEPAFYRAFLDVLGLDPVSLGEQLDREAWPAATARIADVVATRTRAEWEQAFAGVDACVQAVLELAEVPEHAHVRARGGFTDVHGTPHPAPAPRLSRTPAQRPDPAEPLGASTVAVLAALGRTPEQVHALCASGAAGVPAEREPGTGVLA